MPVTTRDPVDMTSQERLQEIAGILADCAERLSKNHIKQGNTTTSERSLSGLSGRRKHSCDHAENQSGDE